jgi:hypothetical protein
MSGKKVLILDFNAYPDICSLNYGLMNQSKQIFILTLLISIALFILGQFVFVGFFEFFEPKFDLIVFKVIERQTGIRTSILFSITLFLIPILTVLTWRFAPIVSKNKKIASAFIILCFAMAAIWIRHQEVKSYFTWIIKSNFLYIKDNKPVSYPIDPVNFVYFMAVGIIIGCIVSGLSFREERIK